MKNRILIFLLLLSVVCAPRTQAASNVVGGVTINGGSNSMVFTSGTNTLTVTSGGALQLNGAPISGGGFTLPYTSTNGNIVLHDDGTAQYFNALNVNGQLFVGSTTDDGSGCKLQVNGGASLDAFSLTATTPRLQMRGITGGDFIDGGYIGHYMNGVHYWDVGCATSGAFQWYNNFIDAPCIDIDPATNQFDAHGILTGNRVYAGATGDDGSAAALQSNGGAHLVTGNGDGMPILITGRDQPLGGSGQPYLRINDDFTGNPDGAGMELNMVQSITGGRDIGGGGTPFFEIKGVTKLTTTSGTTISTGTTQDVPVRNALGTGTTTLHFVNGIYVGNN